MMIVAMPVNSVAVLIILLSKKAKMMIVKMIVMIQNLVAVGIVLPTKHLQVIPVVN